MDNELLDIQNFIYFTLLPSLQWMVMIYTSFFLVKYLIPALIGKSGRTLGLNRKTATGRA